MECQSLLDAIRANPQEDVPRLMYGDWLEEHASPDTDDLVKATVEFIRVSCSMKVGGTDRMPRAGYKWVSDNWKRLVPATLKLHKPYRVGSMDSYIQGNPIFMVNGRKVWMRIGLEGVGWRSRNESKIYACSMEISLWKGFVQDFRCFSSFTSKMVSPVLESEQPLMRMGMDSKKPVVEINPMETS